MVKKVAGVFIAAGEADLGILICAPRLAFLFQPFKNKVEIPRAAVLCSEPYSSKAIKRA